MSEETRGTSPGLQALADRHGVSLEGVRHLVRALEAGHGNMAQFDHPDLGGFGQWSRGGMVMIGRMNDHALKARVDALCTELSAALPPAEMQGASGAGHWWPEGLGQPSSVGAQNGTRYAFFPGSRRLAVETDGRVVLYDTGGREVTGVSQQQGGSASFAFSGPGGGFSLHDLARASPEDAGSGWAEPAPPARPERSTLMAAEAPAPPEMPKPAAAEAPAPARAASNAASATGASDVLTLLERLAELHRKGVLTEAEFSAKKTELLARL
ncbi:SHOCT domain-containing protein [Methylobacterium sp. Leaf118]|uniref:SHOCT domain-containing protein n=1 Tax=Methylobacterium sp. Leaf118 TaxID=2876562 RepID=UPI001E4E0CC7|nr:SHOCT domain-containing protein [Methylobacterium sp. Leaf118]